MSLVLTLDFFFLLCVLIFFNRPFFFSFFSVDPRCFVLFCFVVGLGLFVFLLFFFLGGGYLLNNWSPSVSSSILALEFNFSSPYVDFVCHHCWVLFFYSLFHSFFFFFFFYFSVNLFGVSFFLFFFFSFFISRVPDQNGVSLLNIMLETHHSGQEPMICSCSFHPPPPLPSASFISFFLLLLSPSLPLFPLSPLLLFISFFFS